MTFISIYTYSYVLPMNRDFDDSLLQRVNEVAHEDDIKDILPPDVSNYLISEVSDWLNELRVRLAASV